MLVTAVGSPAANSYVSVEKADSVMPLFDPDWLSRPEKEKEFLLRSSASDIERVPFLGVQMFFGQAMQFPRKGDVLVNSHTITSGFSYVDEEFTSEKVTAVVEDVSYSRQQTRDSVTFLFTSDEFLQGVQGEREVTLEGPVANTDHTLRLLLREVSRPETYNTPPVYDDFGHVVTPGSEGVRMVWRWEPQSLHTVSPEGTPTAQPIPEVMPAVTLSTSGILTVSAVNGSVIEIPAGVSEATGTTYTKEVITSSGRNPRKIRNDSLVFTDRPDILPTFLQGAGLHVRNGGERIYASVVSHDIATGTVLLDTDIPLDRSDTDFIYIDPVPAALVRAQIEQLKIRVGATMTDPFAGMGLQSIKIGDTSRTYANRDNTALALNNIAGRLGIGTSTLILLGKYTTYCKTLIGWQQNIEEALAASLTAES